MAFRLRRRLGLADAITLVNAVVGFVAAPIAFLDPHLAARLLLLAVIVDALDGITARNAGNTDVGPLLDSITDVVSFGATPGVFVVAIVAVPLGGIDELTAPLLAATLLAGASFAVLSVVRTAFYSVYVEEGERRPGVPNALGATVLAAAYLTGSVPPEVLVAATPVLAVLMVAPIGYPNLRARDAVVLGVVQALAIVVPGFLAGLFPALLLVAALAYLVLSPRYYWTDGVVQDP